MNRIDITNAKKKIQKHFLEKEYLKAYDSLLNLLDVAESNAKDFVKNDFFYCYIYMSNCLVELNRLDMAVISANKALSYSVKDYEFLLCYNLSAMCCGELGDIDGAVKIYNDCILECDNWLNGGDIFFKEDKDKIVVAKADAINNIGDLLQDENIMMEAIVLYCSVLAGVDNDILNITAKINKSYESICQINPNFIHTSVSASI